MMFNKQINMIFKNKFVANELKTLLNQQSLDDLYLSYRVLSGDNNNFNKKELINVFTENICYYIDLILNSFTKEMYDFLLNLINNNGEIPYHEDMNVGLILYMRLLLIGFPVTKNRKKVIIMAKEILSFFKEYPFTKLTKQINLNKLVCDYTRYLIIIYGYFETEIIFEQIKKWENLDLDFNDYEFLLNNDGVINGYEIIDDYIKSFEIDEIPNFFAIRKKYEKFNYYQPTKKEIFGKVPLPEAEIDILYFCETELLLSENMALDNLLFIKQMILFEYTIEEIMEIMNDEYDFTTYEYKKLEKLVEALYYNTRLWTLKGNTRNEIKMPKLIKFPKG